MVTGAVRADAATVLFEGRTVDVAQTMADPSDLWVSPADLTRINGFVLKPEGACLNEMCIPVPQGKENAMVKTRAGVTWFNVTELARKLGQEYEVDTETGTWSFGEIPAVRSTQLKSAIAPDFELKDRTGKVVHLSDLRGQKMLLKTWASW